MCNNFKRQGVPLGGTNVILHPFQWHLRVLSTSSTTRSDDTLGE